MVKTCVQPSRSFHAAAVTLHSIDPAFCAGRHTAWPDRSGSFAGLIVPGAEPEVFAAPRADIAIGWCLISKSRDRDIGAEANTDGLPGSALRWLTSLTI
jgi:hypothetical protein